MTRRDLIKATVQYGYGLTLSQSRNRSLRRVVHKIYTDRENDIWWKAGTPKPFWIQRVERVPFLFNRVK